MTSSGYSRFPQSSSKLESLQLPLRIKNALIKNNILTIEDFLAIKKRELLKIRNIGQKSSKYLLDIQQKYKSGKYIPHKDSLYPTNRQINKIKNAYNLYYKLGTLQAVAKELNLTRERVRQLLNTGQEYNLFKYITTRELNMIKLVKRIDKNQLVDAINKSPKIFDVCSELSVNVSEYHKLVRHHEINAQDYFYDSRKRKYITKYSKIVDFLGYHPSTTELQRRPEWRYTYNAIVRIWTSIERFRTEFGIDKPPFKLHPNTLMAFNKAKAKKIIAKKDKKNKVLNTIKFHKLHYVKAISKTLNISEQTAAIYLNELVDESHLIKIKTGIRNKYILNR